MHRATGPSKNILLTLWLLLPFAVLAVIIAVIFATYGNTKMNARPVGSGAGDTGGANAIGELLAGNDPDERARQNRERREGRLIDPLDWPGGLYTTLQPATTAVGDIILISWTGSPSDEPQWHIHAGLANPQSQDEAKVIRGRVGASGDLPKSRVAAIAESPHTGAGFYISPTRETGRSNGTLNDLAGNPLPRIDFPLVERGTLSADAPLRLIIRVDFSAEPVVTVAPTPP